MSTPALPSSTPGQGQVVYGDVVQPAKVISPRSSAIAEIGQVIKHLITRNGVYHDEPTQTAALAAVDKLTKAFSDGEQDIREEHRAPVAAAAPPVQLGPGTQTPQIDYTALARAMLAIRGEQGQPQNAGQSE